MPALHPKPTLPRLLALTLLVLMLHALVLIGMPSTIGLLAQDAPALPAPTAHFEMRTIAADPVAPTPVAAPPARPRAARVAAAKAVPPSPTSAAPATDTPANPPPANGPALNDADGSGSTGSSEPARPHSVQNTLPQKAAPPPSDAALAALPTTPSPPPAPSAELQPPNAVAFAPSTRLQYEGKGEERGFIKYAGSGELLWLQDGGQYSARLEISAWGFRVRTWTSKGALGDAGLQPLRFGDKPRGAELATHFQRDKNIISFSANNPDVPLQLGAQDKLSALLQLGALVAGAPARYAAGTSLHFQAADAHRAEEWTFTVGGEEMLDLPGGPLKGLKLSKAPTVEFDQGIEVWLAPGMHYLPVRLRITEANGAFVDLLWRNTQKAEGG